MLGPAYNIGIDQEVQEKVHGRAFVDALNSNDKRFISTLMKSVEFTGSKGYGV